jgi:hypothetical protein
MPRLSLARLGAAAGLAYVVLVVIGNDVINAGNSPDFTASPQAIAAYLASHPPTTATYVGGFVELIGLLCLLAFIARLYGVLRRAEGGDGFLSVTALGAGLVSVAIKVGSAPAMLEAFNRAREGMDPQLTAALVDMNGFAFMLTLALDALMLAAAGAVVLRTAVLPRWLGVTAVGLAPLLLVTVAGAARIPPLAMLLALLWIAAVSVVLIRRSGEARAPAVAAQPSTTAA